MPLRPERDAPLERCSICEQIPSLCERSYDDGRDLRIVYWYECRRWFGLRICQQSALVTNFQKWADLAQRRAKEAWNRIA